MTAIVWHGIGDIRQDKVPEPKIKEPTDAIEAYKAFDLRKPGWIKAELEPGSGMNHGLGDCGSDQWSGRDLNARFSAFSCGASPCLRPSGPRRRVFVGRRKNAF